MLLLNDPPIDCITQLEWLPSSSVHILLSTSWDGGVRLHDISSNKLISSHGCPHAVLDGCFVDNGHNVIFGGLSHSVEELEIASGRITKIGSHKDTIRCVKHNPMNELIYTGSWDQTIQTWDRRLQRGSPNMVAQTDGRVFAMDVNEHRVVIGTSNKKIQIFDVRNLSSPLTTRLLGTIDSSSSSRSGNIQQIRSLKCTPDQKGFACGYVDGRVSIEYIEDAINKSQMFSFRCHREKMMDKEAIYPVNSLSFHPRWGTLITGGSDGNWNIWDLKVRSRTASNEVTDRGKVGISALSINSRNELAVAYSYCFEQGQREQEIMSDVSISIFTLEEKSVKCS